MADEFDPDAELERIKRAREMAADANKTVGENHLALSQGVIANLAAMQSLNIAGNADFFDK